MSETILTPIVTPRVDSYNVIVNETLIPPLLFCMDLTKAGVPPPSVILLPQYKATLKLIQFHDSTDVTDNSEPRYILDTASDIREYWDEPSFRRPAERLKDAEGDEKDKVYFRFADIKLTMPGIFRFDLRVTNPAGMGLASVSTHAFKCLTNTRQQPARDPSPETLANANAILTRLPDLPPLKTELPE